MNTTSTLVATVARGAVVLCLLLWVAAVPPAHAANASPPDYMTFQGYLTDGEGHPLGTNAPKNFDVIFRIYDDQSAGSLLYAEQQTVTVDNGSFSVLLGEGAAVGTEAHPALSSLFASTTASHRFVDITVKGIGSGGTDSPIVPRLRLLTSPYAYLAQKAISAVSLMNDTNRQVVSITGTNLGINKSSPSATLDVNGNVRVSSHLTVSGFTNNGISALNGSVTVSNGDVAILGARTLEFGAGVAGKESNSGKIGYNTWTADALDIVGAGTTASNRKIKLWCDAGVTASGTVTAPAFSGNGTIPLGGIIMWSGTTNDVPAGWALCDGRTVNSRTTPDLRGRFVLGPGKGTGLTHRPTGEASGEESHTLTVGEMPSHSHTTTLADDGYPDGSGDRTDNYYLMHPNRSANQTAFGSSSTGGGTAHNTMPPYYVLAFIMRVQ